MLTFPPILEEYQEDLMNRDVDQELLLWHGKWLALASKDRPEI